MKSYYIIGLFTDDPSLVGEPSSRMRNSVSFQVFITNYHSNKRKVRLLLANIKSFIKETLIRHFWFIYLFKETCFTFDYTLKYAVCELKLGQSRGFSDFRQL